ncbi:MAG: type II toxin-antitoxin system VapC family toxin [Clostridiales Family XIII bacterium]|jgi:PIN domain nuclease of toxin-antitoxin system|nr:type II toxin-antitoxin system VapC family toxin [Clostridiales Family XIII bacterium]
MRFLLDTHSILWFLEDSKRLSEQAAVLIENSQAQNSMAVSIASLWEVTIKHSLGKLQFDGGVANLRAMIDTNGWSVLPIAQSHLESLSSLPFLHRDPFDRLLVATALSESIPLITVDENIRRYGVQCIW